MAVGMYSCPMVIVNLHVNLHTAMNAEMTAVPLAERHTSIHGSPGWRARLLFSGQS
jgi:hypothetical protein